MDKRFPHPFSGFWKSYREYRRKLPDKVSVMALEEMKGNFRIGGYRDGSSITYWKKRSLNAWGKVNDKGRALLIKSGRLRRGLRKRPTFDYAQVINDVPYAEAHNEGFKGSVTQSVRPHNRRLNKKKIAKVRAFKRHIMMDLPARKFMVVGDPFFRRIDQMVVDDLDKMLMQAK